MIEALDTAWIVERAKALGFALCGVVRAEKSPELAHSDEWLERGYAGEMKYLADPRRRDPQAAMPGIRSVIVCALSYNTEETHSIDAALQVDTREPRGWISRYAWGRDYHEVMQEKLEALRTVLRERFSDPFEGRVYADTGPLQERVFAKYAGLGWLGKNTLLLNERMGSWFFLGVILTTLDLPASLSPAEAPPPDLCGNCRQCLDACPTGALVEPYVLDPRKCISYLTIELRGGIPEELREPIGRHVFGCDICQDVCPWNQNAPVTQVQEFQPRRFARNADEGHPGWIVTPAGGSAPVESLFRPRLQWLAAMNEEEFHEVFRESAVKRAKWRGLVRNACIALGNSATRQDAAAARIVALLERLAASPEPLIAESARWALSRIQ